MDLTKWMVQTRKGTLELGILVLLRQKKRYGLEIIELLEDSTGLVITEGTIYPLLSRLRKEGLVLSEWIESESGHPRRYYALSRKGEKLVEEMIKYWKDFSQTINKLIEES
jgi:PadR family transcriptional regulator PadR